LKLDIELTGKCNLKCVMCPQSFGIANGEMTREDFMRILPTIEKAEQVTLHGVGEPILEFALETIPPHVDIFFNTNATLLKKDRSELLLKYHKKIKYINVSLDAATPETYEKIRGGRLDLVLRNLREFKEMRDALGLSYPLIYLNMTIMKENVDELKGLILLSKEFDSIIETWPLNDDGMYGGKKWVVSRKNWSFVYEDQVVSKFEEKYKQTVLEAKELATSVGVKFNMWDAWFEKLDISTCTLPKDTLNFYANGELKHCCFQTKPLLDWRESALSQETYLAQTEKVMKPMKNSQIPAECSQSRCPWVKGETSPFEVRDSNRILDLRIATK